MGASEQGAGQKSEKPSPLPSHSPLLTLEKSKNPYPRSIGVET
jgi:hypothetical protein